MLCYAAVGRGDMVSLDWERKNKAKQLEALGIKNQTGQFKCRRCGSSETDYTQLQTRSADEPMTTYDVCSHVRRFDRLVSVGGCGQVRAVPQLWLPLAILLTGSRFKKNTIPKHRTVFRLNVPSMHTYVKKLLLCRRCAAVIGVPQH